jgi:NADP-dependent 3-hydroxy acid dehydrogenase YdfG
MTDSRPVALVTGGGTGIGAATARALAAQGFEVVVSGRRPGPLASVAAEVGGRALVLDVTDAGAVAAAVGGLDRCDVLVNNAGGAIGVERVEDGLAQDWAGMYVTNVLGTLQVTQAALPLLRRSARATIVNIGSIAGVLTYEGGAGYVAAKHGVHALTETLRLELCGERIRVIEILPGLVATEGFSLTRMRGDQDRADAVYASVDHPLVAADVAACVAFVVGLPQHVNVDSLVVKPVAQAAPHKLHRGPIDWGPEPTP